MHVRQQVRNAITSLVKTVPELEESTFESRVYPLAKEDLPAALIFTENEFVESVTKQRQIIQNRTIEPVIYVFARSNNLIENAIDPLAEAIENVILLDQTLGGVANKTNLSEVNLLIGGEPDATTGADRLSFLSTVLTQQGNSNTPLTNNTGGPFS